MTLHVTRWQREEIAGLLSVYEAEGWPAWAVLKGLDSLEIIDPVEAVDEIRHRIRFFEDEGPKHGANPTSAMRSLEALARKIEALPA